jgi:hypothetical protein
MKRIVIAITLAVALAISLSGCMMFMTPPAGAAAYARTQSSAAQMYRATFTPVDSIKVGRLHKWNIEVTTTDGSPVDSASFTVEGGMPQHGHGLPTKPLVTSHLGSGKHVIEGMKFNMGGWWVVKLNIAAAQGADVVTFNIRL